MNGTNDFFDVLERAISQCKTDAEKEFFKNRAAFAMEYCEKQGWPPNPAELEISQILEIRDQDGWKNPMKNEIFK